MIDYQKFRETFNDVIIKYLKDEKKEMEDQGLIPTLEELINKLEGSNDL